MEPASGDLAAQPIALADNGKAYEAFGDRATNPVQGAGGALCRLWKA